MTIPTQSNQWVAKYRSSHRNTMGSSRSLIVSLYRGWMGIKQGKWLVPFEMVQRELHCKQIVHICDGWFRKVHKDFVVVLTALIRQNMANEVRLTILTLTDMDQKGNSHPTSLKLCI